MFLTTEYILIIFIVILVINIHIDSDIYNLTCVVSEIDNKEYCVRDTPRLKDVVNIFANTAVKVKKLIKYLRENEMDKTPIKRLVERYNPDKIVEILPTSKYTAYSENKGEKIALCATTERDGGELIDENTLMFVVLHELAHIMTVSIGHTKEFWDNFKQLIIYAEKVNIYKPVDYSKKTGNYCGTDILDSPYYS
jgi:hypothetical protein